MRIDRRRERERAAEWDHFDYSPATFARVKFVMEHATDLGAKIQSGEIRRIYPAYCEARRRRDRLFCLLVIATTDPVRALAEATTDEEREAIRQAAEAMKETTP